MKKNFQFLDSTSSPSRGIRGTIFNFQKNQGFALFLAVVITGTLLVVATGMVSLAVKQSKVSVSGRESQKAFYVADTGLECALYWDVRNPSGASAFDPATTNNISCNRDANNPDNQWVVGGGSVSSINITFLPEASCAVVTVTKSGSSTTIESKGYNTCDSSNPRRVERAVRASY